MSGLLARLLRIGYKPSLEATGPDGIRWREPIIAAWMEPRDVCCGFSRFAATLLRLIVIVSLSTSVTFFGLRFPPARHFFHLKNKEDVGRLWWFLPVDMWGTSGEAKPKRGVVHISTGSLRLCRRAGNAGRLRTVRLSPRHHGPCDARHFVGEGDDGDKRRLARQQ